MAVPRSGSRSQSVFHPPQPLSTQRCPRKGGQKRGFGKRKFLYAQVIDIAEVMSPFIRRLNVVQTLWRNRKSRGELLSTSEAYWSTTKYDGMWDFALTGVQRPPQTYLPLRCGSSGGGSRASQRSYRRAGDAACPCAAIFVADRQCKRPCGASPAAPQRTAARLSGPHTVSRSATLAGAGQA